MQYELKRPSKSIFVFWLIITILGIVFLFFRDYSERFFAYGLIGIGLGVPLLIYEIYKISSPNKLFFDETGFSVGNSRYSYKDIEDLKTTLYRGSVEIEIIINGGCIFRFDNSYENSKLFVEILSRNGLSINLFEK